MKRLVTTFKHGAIFVTPLLGLVMAFWILGLSPIVETKNTLKASHETANAQLSRLQEKLASFNEASGKTPVFANLTWASKNGSNAALDIQTKLDALANTHRIQVQLIGPYGSDKIEPFQRHIIELEGEANYKDVLAYVDALEAVSPVLGIRHLSIRPLANQNQAQRGTRVFFRAVVWGYSEQ